MILMYKQKRKTCCQKPVEHRIKGTDHSCGDIEELSEKNSGAGVFRAELDDPRGNLCALVLMLAYLFDHGVSLPLEPGEVQAGPA